MADFGWSYPPGCSGPPDEPEDCDVCGALDLTLCVCRVCRTCGAAGDPSCYADYVGQWRKPCGASMHKTAEQFRNAARREAADRASSPDYVPELHEDIEGDLTAFCD